MRLLMKKIRFFSLFVVTVLLLCGCASYFPETKSPAPTFDHTSYSLSDLPGYAGAPYVVLQDNVPSFSDKEKETRDCFESYADLDFLGRCGVAFACVGRDLMPTEKRGAIGQVKPSGWQTVKFDFVDGKYLYNRCHLIGYQLSGENANEKNLITGTRYLNVEGMLPFENMVADFVKETGQHVLYRVTPVFLDDDLVARGVEIEAFSLEDQGEAVSFHVYCYNVQPGVVIDYATGQSHAGNTTDGGESTEQTYVLNLSSKKIHLPDCDYAKQISAKNRKEVSALLEDLLRDGYTCCHNCLPS